MSTRASKWWCWDLIFPLYSVFQETLMTTSLFNVVMISSCILIYFSPLELITSKNTFHWLSTAQNARNKISTLRSNGCHNCCSHSWVRLFIFLVKVIVSLIFTSITWSCAKVKDAGELQTCPHAHGTQRLCQFCLTWQWMLRSQKLEVKEMEAHLLQMCTVSLLLVTPEISMLTRHGKILFSKGGLISQGIKFYHCCRNQYLRNHAPHLESWRTQVYYASGPRGVNTPSSDLRTKGLQSFYVWTGMSEQVCGFVGARMIAKSGTRVGEIRSSS